ncbi:MAG: hypothetical protein Q9191_001974 [Dirinaria sp. TL-2023a]
MRSFRILFIILAQCCLPLIKAHTIPLNYTTLPNPPGFDALIEFHTGLINPLGVYINAIDAISSWCKTDWDSEFIGTAAVIDPRLGVSIKYTDRVGPESERPPIKLSYILLGLYQGVIRMSDKNQFREMTIWLRFENKIGGVIRIAHPFKPHTTLEGPSNSSNLALTNGYNNVNSTEDSGEVLDPDPEFHGLSIDWKFDGRTIHAIEVFTTILDAMVSTATERADAERSYVYGISFSGNTALNVHELSGAPSHLRKVTNSLIRESLLLIAKYVFHQQRRFIELDFTIKDLTRGIAEGFFLKISSVQANGTRGTATAK